MPPTPALAALPARRWLTDPAALAPAPAAALAGLMTEPGLLTERLRRGYHGDLTLEIVEERRGTLAEDDRLALGVAEAGAFVREIELWCAGAARVFAQTLVPQATLARVPWLATLGRAALGETLAGAGAVERGPLEFAALLPGDALYGRALRAADLEPAVLWARRSWFAVAGRRLMVQEVFLPGVAA